MVADIVSAVLVGHIPLKYEQESAKVLQLGDKVNAI